MNSFQETQSDLEVILEFLEEYYRQNTGENVDKMYWAAGVDERSAPVDEVSCEQRWTWYEPPSIKPAPQPFLAQYAPPPLSRNTTATLSDHVSVPKFVSTRHDESTKHQPTVAGNGRKVRLFHFLFEMLEDPNMAHCVSWVPAAAGVFRFSSRNKDQVAALWGQRKGNKRPMTYQKMSRALRNYARSGEIFKVKKKLTYQFSRDTLMLLQKFHRADF
ncbi:transcription factor Spi-C-like [Seriola lalandi dorsalis]|uniref:transcription factor Spi-C-like n=1 Tax=Seriola lalandi dorsalis TaxID=1841481 RepID=UPI000C6FB66C|nr:transcription factor Spi-C-like [Seriola lalandi dorsalis]